MNPTNDPDLTSFVEVEPESHFPIQNLPYGLARPKNGGESFLCSAIGNYVVNLAELEAAGVFDGPQLNGEHVFRAGTLNDFMELEREASADAGAP
jgi:fumarylacetoacetase